jgi:hypothetical protein
VPRSADRPGQSEASFQHPAVALARNRRHRRGHQPPHALARPCQNRSVSPGTAHSAAQSLSSRRPCAWYGRRPRSQRTPAGNCTRSPSAGLARNLARRSPPLIRCQMSGTSATSDAGGSRCAGASSAGPRMGKRRAPVEAWISQPRRDPAELLLFGDILPGGNHPAQPRHDGTRVRRAVPRSPRGRRPPAPPRRAPRLPPASTAPPARRAEHHRHPRPQIRWSRTDNAPVRGDAARGGLPRSSPSRGLLEGVRIDDTGPDPAATRRASSAT